jgi:hypothetical protein
MFALFAIATRSHANFGRNARHSTLRLVLELSDSARIAFVFCLYVRRAPSLASVATKLAQSPPSSTRNCASRSPSCRALSQPFNNFIHAECRDCQDLANIYRCLRQKDGRARDNGPIFSRTKSLKLGRCRSPGACARALSWAKLSFLKACGDGS